MGIFRYISFYISVSSLSSSIFSIWIITVYIRSENMDLYQILVPKDNDWDILNELGHLNCIQFIDLNKGEQPHHLRYINQVKRAEEAQRKIQ